MFYLGTKDHYKFYANFEEDTDGIMNPFELGGQLWHILGFGSDYLPTTIDSMNGFDNYMAKHYNIETDTATLVQNCRDSGLSEDEFFDKLHEYMAKRGIFTEPVAIFEHDSAYFSIGTADGWDCGTGAIAVVSKKEIREAYEVKRVTKTIRKRVYNDLKMFLRAINDDNNGNLGTIFVKDQKGNDVTQSPEFYGSDLDNIDDKAKKLSFAVNLCDDLKPYSEYKHQLKIDDYEGLLNERKQLKAQLNKVNAKIAQTSSSIKQSIAKIK